MREPTNVTSGNLTQAMGGGVDAVIGGGKC